MKKPFRLPPFSFRPIAYLYLAAFNVALLATSTTHIAQQQALQQTLAAQKAAEIERVSIEAETQVASLAAELNVLKTEDQRLKNEELKQEIASIQKTYKLATQEYELMKDLELTGKDANKIESLFATSLKELSERKWTSASATLSEMKKELVAVQEKQAQATPLPAPVNNSPPGSGYSRQQVETDVGTFTVSIISADLNSTRVLVDTASDGDCKNDCPVMSVASYAARSGAFAAVNGSYFCPASYPQCADKKNSFDTLLMNKNKHYFNSDNNVYSTVPAVIFNGSGARFVGRSLDWGRDTGVDAVIANQPLLLSGGNVVFGGDGDPKKGSRSGRSFIGTKGSTVYIGVVHGATVAEGARVLQRLGLSDALNLDGGGSVALWNGGYKVGPGRDIPNAIVLVRK